MDRSTLSHDASTLAFHGRAERHDPSRFERFIGLATEQMDRLGVKPNYVAVEGAGWAGSFQPLKGAVARKFATIDLASVSTLSLAAVSEGTDDPAEDRFASVSLSYVVETGELLCCAVVNQTFLPFASAEFDALASLLAGVARWDYGYGFADRLKSAEFHVLALDPGDLTAEAYRSLCAWYEADLNARAAALRDVYPYNFLSRRHLDILLSDGRSLGGLVLEQCQGALRPFDGSELYLWRVAETDRAPLRASLARSGALLA